MDYRQPGWQIVKISLRISVWYFIFCYYIIYPIKQQLAWLVYEYVKNHINKHGVVNGLKRQLMLDPLKRYREVLQSV